MIGGGGDCPPCPPLATPLWFVTLFIFLSVISCGDPGIPTNGERIGSGINAGNELNYECKPGFKLIGESKLVCQQDGTWSDSPPRCDGKEFSWEEERVVTMSNKNIAIQV